MTSAILLAAAAAVAFTTNYTYTVSPAADAGEKLAAAVKANHAAWTKAKVTAAEETVIFEKGVYPCADVAERGQVHIAPHTQGLTSGPDDEGKGGRGGGELQFVGAGLYGCHSAGVCQGKGVAALHTEFYALRDYLLDCGHLCGKLAGKQFAGFVL